MEHPAAVKPWKRRALALTRVLLPTGLYWQLENRLQVRAGYVHEPDMELFALLDDLDIECLDVGAHRGESALAMLMRAPRSRVTSFEPNPQAAPALAWIRRRFAPRYDYRLAALGSRPGRVTLHVPASGRIRHPASASLNAAEFDQTHVRDRLRDEAGGRDFDRCIERRVDLQRIDDLGRSWDVIKIDVEGSEAAVLEGAKRTLAEHAPLLIIEFNHDGAFRPLLESFGYAFFRFDAGRRRLLPLLAGEANPLNLIALSDRSRPALRKRLGLP